MYHSYANCCLRHVVLCPPAISFHELGFERMLVSANIFRVTVRSANSHLEICLRPGHSRSTMMYSGRVGLTPYKIDDYVLSASLSLFKHVTRRVANRRALFWGLVPTSRAASTDSTSRRRLKFDATTSPSFRESVRVAEEREEQKRKARQTVGTPYLHSTPQTALTTVLGSRHGCQGCTALSGNVEDTWEMAPAKT